MNCASFAKIFPHTVSCSYYILETKVKNDFIILKNSREFFWQMNTSLIRNSPQLAAFSKHTKSKLREGVTPHVCFK